MKIPRRLTEFFEQSGVRYKLLHHPVAYTSQELAAIEGVKGREHAKVVIVQSGERLLMAVLPADHRIDLASLAQVTGRPAVLAPEESFKQQFPDCETGTMPPFGQLYGVEMLVDRILTQNESIAFEAGTHSDAVIMKYADYETLAKPTIAEFAVKVA